MYLLRMILLVLMISLFKVPSLYSDEVSTEAVQNMQVTGSVVNKEDKEADADLDEESDEPQVEKININTADIEELKTLHGIGTIIAKRIIQYRKTHGRFNTIEEIKNIEGIGEKKFKKMKNTITVNKKGTVLFTDEAKQ